MGRGGGGGRAGTSDFEPTSSAGRTFEGGLRPLMLPDSAPDKLALLIDFEMTFLGERC